MKFTNFFRRLFGLRVPNAVPVQVVNFNDYASFHFQHDVDALRYVNENFTNEELTDLENGNGIFIIRNEVPIVFEG